MSAGFSCPSLRSIFLVQYFNWKLPQKVKSAGFSCPVLLPEVFFKSKFQSKTSRSWSLQEFFVHLYIRKYFPVQYFNWKLPEVQVCRVLHSIFVFEKKISSKFQWETSRSWNLQDFPVHLCFRKKLIAIFHLKTSRSRSLQDFPVHLCLQKQIWNFSVGVENLQELKSARFSCPWRGSKICFVFQFWGRKPPQVEIYRVFLPIFGFNSWDLATRLWSKHGEQKTPIAAVLNSQFLRRPDWKKTFELLIPNKFDNPMFGGAKHWKKRTSTL